MAIYKLEESPDVYITPRYYGNKFMYQMAHISGELNRRIIRTTDLRSDQLMIYGTEIKQSLLDKLHQSLVLRQKSGVIYVNCNGACYFLIPGKGCYRPVHNAIFDWSLFGVLVPNSMSDSLRKQLEQSRMETSQIQELKEQISACQNEKKEMEAKLKAVCDQLSLVDFALETNKIELDSSKKEVKKLRDQLSMCKKETRNLEVEMQKVRNQLSSSNSELQSAMSQLELSKKRVIALEEQLSIVKKETEGKEKESQRVKDQLSSELNLSRKRVMELEEQKEGMEIDLEKANNQLSSTNLELERNKEKVESLLASTKELENQLNSTREESQQVERELQIQIEFSKKMVEELREQLLTCEKEGESMKMELQKVCDQLCLANDELQSTRNQLESYEEHVQELESQSCKREIQHMEEELQKTSNHLSSIDSEVKSATQKLDQLLISMMWSELDRCNNSQARSRQVILDTQPRDTISGDTISNLTLCITIEDE